MSARGCDLSHHNDGIDFHALKEAGISFVALKATEGAGYVDPTYADRIERARSVGFARIIHYHFFSPLADSQAQAQNLAHQIGELGPNELIAIDVEQCDGWDKIPSALAAARVCHLIEAAKTLLGLHDDRILIYGSVGWLRGQFGDSLETLTAWQLWAARYGASDPGDVSPWSDWLIWQFSSKGSVSGAGAPGTVDTDVWHGDL